MPPLIFSPLIKIALGALGAGAIVHWAVKEVRRINEELDRVKRASSIDPATRQAYVATEADGLREVKDGVLRAEPTLEMPLAGLWG